MVRLEFVNRYLCRIHKEKLASFPKCHLVSEYRKIFLRTLAHRHYYWCGRGTPMVPFNLYLSPLSWWIDRKKVLGTVSNIVGHRSLWRAKALLHFGQVRGCAVGGLNLPSPL